MAAKVWATRHWRKLADGLADRLPLRAANAVGHHQGRREPHTRLKVYGHTLFDREQVDGRKLDANPRINNDAFVEDPVKNIE